MIVRLKIYARSGLHHGCFLSCTSGFLNSFPLFLVTLLLHGPISGSSTPLEIGTRLEPFFDRYLIEDTHRLSHVLGTPQKEGVVLRFDEPWERYFTGYISVIQHGGKFLMYYRGWPDPEKESYTCYAESNDGFNWRKPALGLHSYGGREDTNIILASRKDVTSNFCPFLDTNPAVRPQEKFKAIGGNRKNGLFALSSEDGIHWELMRDEPVFRDGAFDSQNVPFWSETEGRYVLYFRIFSDGPIEDANRGYRTIARTTSRDFIHWSEPERMTFDDAPQEHLYTNQTHPYYRAPHIYLSFPMRFRPDRQLLTADEARTLNIYRNREKGVSDTVFMTSRGGNNYDRPFRTALFRPGPDRNMWVARNSMMALGVVPLDEGRLGFYKQQHYAAGSNHLVLYSLREDGFASYRAGSEEGYLTTKPIKQSGTRLNLNFATSAVGWIKVEVQDAEGEVIQGFEAKRSAPRFGDSLEESVHWDSGKSWKQLTGRTVRLRIYLCDADLYSIQQQ